MLQETYFLSVCHQLLVQWSRFLWLTSSLQEEVTPAEIQRALISENKENKRQRKCETCLVSHLQHRHFLF